MPKYLVRLATKTHYEMIVEADNESDAREEAVEIWCYSEDPDSDFGAWDDGVEAEREVEEIDEQTPTPECEAGN
jgi:hypothetical protein